MYSFTPNGHIDSSQDFHVRMIHLIGVSFWNATTWSIVCKMLSILLFEHWPICWTNHGFTLNLGAIFDTVVGRFSTEGISKRIVATALSDICENLIEFSLVELSILTSGIDVIDITHLCLCSFSCIWCWPRRILFMIVLFHILYCFSFTECSMITCKSIEDALGLLMHSDYVSTFGAVATSEKVSFFLIEGRSKSDDGGKR